VRVETLGEGEVREKIFRNTQERAGIVRKPGRLADERVAGAGRRGRMPLSAPLRICGGT
jgi:hypothetical protein